ncbi:MAG: hypothetical protein HRU19_23940 [Pseudobacteriovorax sp.]|nr:hypothetical protein [Pseudobacteriovorax sp.]
MTKSRIKTIMARGLNHHVGALWFMIPVFIPIMLQAEPRKIKHISELNEILSQNLSKAHFGFRQFSWQEVHQSSILDVKSCKECNLGNYRIRSGGVGRSIAIQIPHRYSDLMTFPIGYRLCQMLDVQACGFNTSHRRSFDFAHHELSPFQDFTKALLSHDPDMLIVQIHGFRQSKRNTDFRPETHIILSGGAKKEAWWIEKGLKMINLHRDPRIKIFGRDTSELGGTTNKQNVLMRALGKGRFLHIELSFTYRQRLLYDARELFKLKQIIHAMEDTTKNPQVHSSRRAL